MQPSDQMLYEMELENKKLEAERDAARAEAAALRQRIAQGPEVITAKIQTALPGCSECKVAAEAAALRAAFQRVQGLACLVLTVKSAPAWIIEKAQTVNDLCEKITAPADAQKE